MAGTTATPTSAPVNRRPTPQIARYIRESYIELTKKVSWPTREQTMNLTIVVVVVCVAIALFLGGIDFLFASLVKVLAK